AAIADQEADKADSQLDAAAAAAIAQSESVSNRFVGNDDPKPDQRKAAVGVGNESAKDILAKKPGIRAELRKKAEDASGCYVGFADAVVKEIDKFEEQLAAAIEAAAKETASALQAAHESVVKAIDTRLKVDIRALSEAERLAVGQLEQA